MNRKLFLTAALSSLTILTGCIVSESDPSDPGTGGGGGEATTGGGGQGGEETTGGGGEGAGGGQPAEMGYVLSMSNAPEGNELLVFERDADGALTSVESLPTGGMGSGAGLGSQGAITTSPDGQFLYVVNAGSDQISSFRIYDDHLALVDLVSSGGERPVSVTASDDRIFVVNADGDNVQGFTVDEGILTAVASQPLSGTGTGPAQVGLTPGGDALIVTEKATNSLVTYWVAPDGTMSAPTVSASVGATPFGFDFDSSGVMVVSEAFMGNEGESAASSYVLGSVEPEPISSSVGSGQSAACWLVIARDQFAYTTNTASNTISGYTIGEDGSIDLFEDAGVTIDLGPDQGPLDAALSAGDEYLYVINNGSDTIVGFAIADDGSLEQLPGSFGVPETALGLAAR